ncbi:YfhD family protein [Pontibacillus sp. HMF3514]|uniref:YfhD family protein n=1 Tax=Pontibacillus sp. HMF3514 TaxID=2692425 RepID=UPI00131F69E9|nr:YfhD family protein [Pontibacillus sp. HMF3514]QHE52397.1 YfhD family protein [Pontibacillus sp. HMF3514]
MTRGQSKKGADKTKSRLPQTPKKDIVEDGQDVEFSQEFADQDDLKAQQREKEADQRAAQRNQQK